MSQGKFERDHQWDFKAGDGPTYLAYLYLDGKDGPNVAVGQNYHDASPKPPSETDFSCYKGDKDIPATVVNPKDNKKYTVTKIADCAFASAISVHKVSLPSTIEEIEEYAFLYNAGLNIIDLNEGLKKIGEGAFKWCINLNDIAIPDSVTDLGYDAFFECVYMTRAIIGAGITSMDCSFWKCDNLREVTCRAIVPPVITKGTFSDEVFKNATLYVPFQSYEAYKKNSMWGKFGKIEPIPESIPTTGEFYFMVDGIRYKTKGDNSNEVYVAPLEKGVYGDNRKVGSDLSGVYVAPDASQGSRPQSSRTQGTVMIIPSQVQFANKTYTVTGICESAFKDSTIAKVELPNTIKDIGNSAFRCAQISSIVIPNSVHFIGNSAFYGCQNLTEIDIPGSIAAIGDETFYRCIDIKRIILHNGLKTIGKHAFENVLALEQLTIPDTVVEIGEYAFYAAGSHSLNRLVLAIPNSVVAIGENAFTNCRLKGLTLGNGLTKIEKSVFFGSELKELVIPAGITFIGNGAFAENGNNLQTIKCESATPPKIGGGSTFDELTFKNATLEVPKGALDAYRKDAVWGKFSQFDKDNTDEKHTSTEPIKEPDPIREISEPIRYITLTNKSEYFATVIIHSSNGDITVGEISSILEKTYDIVNYARIRSGNKVWLEVVVKGENLIASQRFVFNMNSDKKAEYTIKGIPNVLSYDGIKDSK